MTINKIKIKEVKVLFDDPSKNIINFNFLSCIIKSNGEIDRELIKDLKKYKCLEKMKKNLKDNCNNKKVKRYCILLNNGEWVEGHKIGTI